MTDDPEYILTLNSNPPKIEPRHDSQPNGVGHAGAISRLTTWRTLLLLLTFGIGEFVGILLTLRPYALHSVIYTYFRPRHLLLVFVSTIPIILSDIPSLPPSSSLYPQQPTYTIHSFHSALTMSKIFSKDEVASHKTKDDLWLANDFLSTLGRILTLSGTG